MGTVVFIAFISSFSNAGTSLDAGALCAKYFPEDREGTQVCEWSAALATSKHAHPFSENKGSWLPEYDLSQYPFAVGYNDEGKTVDLILFNFSDEFAGGVIERDFSRALGETVYVVKGLDKTLLMSQDPYGTGLRLSNFSVIYSPAGDGVRLSNPNYLPVDHPLRSGLGGLSAPAIYPSIHVFNEIKSEFSSFPLSRQEEALKTFELLLHEGYHVAEGSYEVVHGDAPHEWRKLDRKVVPIALKQLEERRLQFLLRDYERAAKAAALDLSKLNGLAAIMERISESYPEFFACLSRFEYQEGLAEYARAFYLSKLGIIQPSQVIENLANVTLNAPPYRTGAYAAWVWRTLSAPYALNKGRPEVTSLWKDLIDFKQVEPDSIFNEASSQESLGDYNIQIQNFREHLLAVAE
ncbi:MAG: hypothetical protein ACXWQE_08385 [Bdellovibrionales bacterium]